MTAVTITTASTEIIAPNSVFNSVDIYNNSAQVVYLNYDGGPATVANGLPLAATGGMIRLTGAQCRKGIYGIVAAATADVRVQAIA